MTNEQAIERLVYFRSYDFTVDNLDITEWLEFKECIDIAIKSLSKSDTIKPYHEYGDSVASTSADTARVEDVWGIVEGIIGRCTCDIAYVSRQMTDPNCSWCDYHVDLIEAITTYAAPIRAEVERLKEIISAYGSGKDHYAERCESLLSELSAANQRIAELERLLSLYKAGIELLKDI